MLCGNQQYYTVGIGWTRVPAYDWPDGEVRFCPSSSEKSKHCYHVDELLEAVYGPNCFDVQEE